MYFSIPKILPKVSSLLTVYNLCIVFSYPRLLFRVVSLFVESDIPHNLFMCRANVFPSKQKGRISEPLPPDCRDSTQATVQVFLWPRKPTFGKNTFDTVATFAAKILRKNFTYFWKLKTAFLSQNKISTGKFIIVCLRFSSMRWLYIWLTLTKIFFLYVYTFLSFWLFFC